MTTSLNNEFGSFQTLSRLLEPVNVCWSEFLRTSSRLKKREEHSSTYVRCRSLTSSIKRRLWREYVVLVHWRSKKCTEERDTRAELLF